jgi:hypothetical protein
VAIHTEKYNSQNTRFKVRRTVSQKIQMFVDATGVRYADVLHDRLTMKIKAL